MLNRLIVNKSEKNDLSQNSYFCELLTRLKHLQQPWHLRRSEVLPEQNCSKHKRSSLTIVNLVCQYSNLLVSWHATIALAPSDIFPPSLFPLAFTTTRSMCCWCCRCNLVPAKIRKVTPSLSSLLLARAPFLKLFFSGEGTVR